VNEEKTNQHNHVIAMLQDKVIQLSTDFWRLVGEVQYCDLLQREFIHFLMRFQLSKGKLHRNRVIRLWNSFQRSSANFEKSFGFKSANCSADHF
jgi:hypothetical protein